MDELYVQRRGRGRASGALFSQDAPVNKGRALYDACMAAQRFGVSPEAMARNLPYPLEDLRSWRSRVSWLDLVTLLDELPRAGLTIPQIEALGADVAHAPHVLAGRMGRAFVRPDRFLRAGFRWVVPALFPAVDCELEHDGRDLSVWLSVPATFRGCPTYFHLCKGVMANATTAIGYPPAMVEAWIGPHGGRYELRAPPPGRRVDRLRSLARAVIAGPSLALTVSQQEDEIREGYEIIARSHQQFRQMVDALPDGILLHRSGEVHYANPVFADLLGYDSAVDLLGRRWTDHVVDADRERAERAPEAGGELRFRRRDGELIVLELSRSQEVTYQNRSVRMMVARDVSERASLQGKLAVADRMASLGTVAAGVAHELNNPLALVLSTLERARRALADHDEIAVAQQLATALDGAQRVRDIVGDLRLFARTEPDDAPLETVAVTDVVESTLALARGQLEAAATVHVAVDRVPAVRAHRGRLGQVVLNLLLNALHALPEGRPVADSRIGVAVFVEGDEVVVQIDDNGAGIPRDIQQRVFEPFFSTKPHARGGGMGLAVAQNIVQRYGGAIRFESTPGDGTRFRVSLPVAPAGVGAEPEGAATATNGRPAPPSAVRVLLVDDEPGLARAVALGLADEGHDVVTAVSGNEAIRLLDADGGYDAIVCDLMMRDGSGADVFTYLERHRPELTRRVVFMTGGLYRDEERRFVARLDNVCLQKPFTCEDLSRTIASLLE